MAASLDDFDYYAILGVKPDASVDEIKAGFREFARRFHPDRYAGDPERASEAACIYRRGTEAYRALTNLEQRRTYDEELRRGERRLRRAARRPSARPSGSAGRTQGCAPRARPFVVRADLALRAKDFQQARLNLQVALQHDPDNEMLSQRLAELDSQAKSR